MQSSLSKLILVAATSIAFATAWPQAVSPVRSRTPHFDLITTDFDAEVDRLIGLGATKLNEINAGRHWATLADPEGNEFDVIAG